MRKSFCLLPLAAALLLTGCVSLAPQYERPAAPVAEAWPQDKAMQNVEMLTEGLAQWGDFFTEPRLKELIGLGLKNNRDLRSAVYKVEQARALYNVSRGQLLPTVNAVAQETAQGGPASATGAATHSYTASAAMSSYELDLFGRIKSLNEQALQAYFQTESAQRTAQMTVVTEIAQTWLGLGAASEQLRLATETLRSQQESYALVKSSYDLGATNLLELQQALTTVASAKAAQAQAVRTAAQYRNALTLLVGTAVPEALLPATIDASVTAPVSAVSNVPSEVLLRRPDIAAAEAQLKSANANIGVARAAFFPRIALTASIGTTSSELSNLFDAGTRIWSWVPQVSLPIFAGGQNIQNLKAAKAAQSAAVASYEGAIQNGFREVADALATEGTITDELRAREELAQASAESLRLSTERYNNGVDSYLTVLDSQRSNFSAQQGLINSRLARAASLITLYKVMGGGSELMQESGK